MYSVSETTLEIFPSTLLTSTLGTSQELLAEV